MKEGKEERKTKKKKDRKKETRGRKEVGIMKEWMNGEGKKGRKKGKTTK